MEERIVFRSGFTIVVILLAVWFEPSEQTPLCLSPTDCDEDGFSYRTEHHRLNPKYISRVENLSGVKELMETLLMQHNEGGDFTEKTPKNDESLMENTSVKTTTQRPPIVVRLGDILNQFPKIRKSTKKSDNLGVTTVESQQLINPLTTHEYHLEMTTTAQPEPPIKLLNSSEHLDVTTPAPNNATKWENITSHSVNIPPTKPSKKKTKRTTTKGPHTILQLQQLDTLKDGTPSSGNLVEKITRKPTIQPTKQISSLMPLDQDHDVKGKIQLETLNRPIIARRPTTARPVRVATSSSSISSSSSKPIRKPINIIPQPVVGVRPSSPAPGSTGVRNPIRNSTPPSEPENYLISALASIADGDEDADGEDVDEEDEEEEDEEYEENSDESENEEDYEDEEEEDEYPINSAEDTPERENFDSVDTRDVISSIIEEVGAFI